MKKYENMATKEFAERLNKALIDKNDGNQSELARVVGCTPQAVNKWSRGEQFPRDRVLRKVADYLGVTPEYLKYGAPNVPAPVPQPDWLLAYIRPEEAEFLSQLRHLSANGKRQIRVALASAEKLPTDELPPKGSGPN